MNIAPRLEMKTLDKDVRYPCFVEPKYDGEFCVFWRGKLINKYGRVRSNIPITDKLISIFGTNATLYGELLGTDGKAGDIYNLNSNKQNPSRYVVFDIAELDGKDVSLSYYDARKNLIFKKAQQANYTSEVTDDLVWIIGGIVVRNGQELWKEYQTLLRAGFEGVVTKPTNSILRFPLSWVKLKNKATADCKVTLIDEFKERIEVGYWVGSKPHTTRTLTICDLGVKVSNKDKATLKTGDIVEIEYQQVLDSGKLRHPVFKRKRDDKAEADTIVK